MDLEELNKQLNQINNDYKLSQHHFNNNNNNNNQFQSKNQSQSNNQKSFDIQNMNQKNGKDYEARNDINERMNKFHRFDNDFVLRNQYQGDTLNANQNTQLNSYQTVNNDNKTTEDLRENMNNRMDNFIFDNPGNKLPSLVEIHENNLQRQENIGFNYKPVVQNKSKSLYKNEANSRLENYSPLARSSHFSVNKNIDIQSNFYQKPVNRLSKKDQMNDRLNSLPTLSKTITMGNKGGQSNVSYDNRNMNTTIGQESSDLKMVEKSRQTNNNPRMGLSKPNMPNFNDINQGCSNVVFNEYPMFSN
jgi:hypothetical protein